MAALLCSSSSSSVLPGAAMSSWTSCCRSGTRRPWRGEFCLGCGPGLHGWGWGRGRGSEWRRGGKLVPFPPPLPPMVTFEAARRRLAKLPMSRGDRWMPGESSSSSSREAASAPVTMATGGEALKAGGNPRERAHSSSVAVGTSSARLSVLMFPSRPRHVAVLTETVRKGIHDADSEARSIARKYASPPHTAMPAAGAASDSPVCPVAGATGVSMATTAGRRSFCSRRWRPPIRRRCSRT